MNAAVVLRLAPLPFVLALALGGNACSSSSSGGATPGEGQDAGATNDGSSGGGGGDQDSSPGGGDSGPTNSITCGAAPYVNLGLTIKQFASGSTPGAPIGGAKLTASLCPGVTAISADDGSIKAQVTKSTPFYARLAADNYATTLIAEMAYDADKLDISAPVPPALFTALIPNFGPTKTGVVVGVSKDGGTGDCDALDGIAFAVTGHPEAKITYYTNDTIPQATTGTTTTVAGRAAITGLDVSAAPIQITATKAGCTIDFAKAPYTGKAPLEAGAVTLVPAYIH